MRHGSIHMSLATLVLAAGLAMGACGGDSNNRPEITWRPNERLPGVNERWWGERVERYCEEDDDCRGAETCSERRVGTCPRCPRSENVKVCIASGEVTNDLEHAEADDWHLGDHYNDD